MLLMVEGLGKYIDYKISEKKIKTIVFIKITSEKFNAG